MLLALRNILKSRNSLIIFSIIWGLGLAALFRRTCKGRKCIIYRAPAPSQINGKTFKYNNKCYQYTSRQVDCQGKENSAIPPEDFRSQKYY
jgi:hypothetical protein